MTKPNLKLIGQRRRQPKPSSKPLPIPPFLTPAERIEGARFKVLTIERAARQARLRRMVARLQDLDHVA
ncbi:MAG: hypothetical protein KDI79_23155 [Anaerolineae bacterium]|nr:hypothetical protein [Anaerolineae bacterium]